MDDIEKLSILGAIIRLEEKVAKLEKYLKHTLSYELKELIKNGDVKWEIGLSFKEKENDGLD